MASYEGYVKFADDTVICLPCFEGRHGGCPDCGAEEGTGSLDGYNCECSGPLAEGERDAEAQRLADQTQAAEARAENAERVLTEMVARLEDAAGPDGSWPGADAAEIVRCVLQKAGYLV